jgi:hypothetical protein
MNTNCFLQLDRLWLIFSHTIIIFYETEYQGYFFHHTSEHTKHIFSRKLTCLKKREREREREEMGGNKISLRERHKTQKEKIVQTKQKRAILSRLLEM